MPACKRDAVKNPRDHKNLCNLWFKRGASEDLMRNEISALAIPPDILDKLHRRAMLAAEVPMSEPEMRAFVVVIPKVTMPEPTTHNLSPVLGYEARHIRHHANHTTEYYDHEEGAIRDETTRIKRVFVLRQPGEGALIAALREQKADPAALQRPYGFDSALVYGASDWYFKRSDELPHLWKE